MAMTGRRRIVAAEELRQVAADCGSFACRPAYATAGATVGRRRAAQWPVASGQPASRRQQVGAAAASGAR